MADGWDDEADWFEDYNVNELLFSNDPTIVDERAQELFIDAFFNGNDEAYMDLVDYMWDTYEIDFEEAFDWEDFREWYDSQ